MGLLKKAIGIGKGLLTGGADAAAQGYQQGIDAQERMFNVARGDLAPFRQFGQNYLARMNDFMSRGRPSMEEVESTPGYQFRMDQGRKAVENSAIAKGGLFSGNTMRALMDYGQDYATSEYDRELARRQMEYDRMLPLINIGYGAAGGSANIAQNTGNSLAQLFAGQGQAKAAGYRFPMELGATALGAMLAKG